MRQKNTWDDGPEGHCRFSFTGKLVSTYEVTIRGECQCGELIQSSSATDDNARRKAVRFWRNHYRELAKVAL